MTKDDARKKIEELLNLGNLTNDESAWLTRMSILLDRRLGLFHWEQDQLNDIYQRRVQ